MLSGTQEMHVLAAVKNNITNTASSSNSEYSVALWHPQPGVDE